MRVWKVVALVNLALAIGAGGGALWWGQEVRRLRQELTRAREAETRAKTPETAGAGQGGGARSWTVQGIVRAVQRRAGIVMLTHEALPGLMPAMTMLFEAENPRILNGLAPGDRVRFTVKEGEGRLALVAIQKEGQP